MSAQDAVREASEQFYAALNRMADGDADAMAGVWTHGGDATSMHPVGGREVGWDAVRGSFQQVAALASGGRIDLEEQLIRVSGDVAWELGVERGEVTLAGQRAVVEHRVTNVYRRESGAWKIVHHHTDTSPSMLEILDRL